MGEHVLAACLATTGGMVLGRTFHPILLSTSSGKRVAELRTIPRAIDQCRFVGLFLHRCFG